jgi:hypothetical protein
MTDEEREEILNQAFRNISVEREEMVPAGDHLDEDPLEMWERNMPKPEEPRPARKLDTGRGPNPNIYQWIEKRLETDRKFILEVVGEAIGEMLAEQHKQNKRDLSDEVRELKIELAELQTTLCELRTVLAKERGLASALQPMRTVN